LDGRGFLRFDLRKVAGDYSSGEVDAHVGHCFLRDLFGHQRPRDIATYKVWHMSCTRADYEREGKLMPIAARMLRMLKCTPGVVSFEAIRYVLWHKRGQPQQLDHYVSHIRRVTGHVIVKYAGVGYALRA
jgi:hypothetical protein